jgi:hypothetical protein
MKRELEREGRVINEDRNNEYIVQKKATFVRYRLVPEFRLVF